jgi:hypothetical protein
VADFAMSAGGRGAWRWRVQLAKIARDLHADFRSLDTSEARVLLVSRVMNLVTWS